jgi:hypothetical protein
MTKLTKTMTMMVMVMGSMAAVRGSARAETDAADAAAGLEAETEPPRVRNRYRPWHVMVEASAEAPLFTGGRIEFEVPGRVRLGTFIGTMPGPLVGLVETVSRDAVGGELGVAVGDLSRVALERTLAARGFVSWSPFRNRSFYLSAGYSYINLGGDLTSAELLEQALGFDAGDPVNGTASLDIDLHGIHGEVGYRFFAGPVTFRLSLGFTGTVAAQTTVGVDSDIGEAEAREFADQGAELMNGYLKQYAMLPSLGLGIGYDFGF